MADGPYLAVAGHQDLRQRFAHAVHADRLPQSLLLYGPRGVGKQRLGLWTAAAIACTGESPPCGTCRSCRLAARLEHPDIHWFFPTPRPRRASSPEALRGKLEDLRMSILEERRDNPLYIDEEEGATGIYVAAVHSMRQLAHKSPAMGRAKVLVIGRAEAMVPQMGSPEAANALLKLLEEPPADTTLILTSDVPGALLPTIRSRVQAVRVGPLSTQQVADFLTSQVGLEPSAARRLATLSDGSIGRALELQNEQGEGLQEDARELVRALLDGRQAVRLATAHSHRAFGARGAFLRTLGETRSLLRDLLAEAAGAQPADPDALSSLPRRRPATPEVLIRALAALEEASELADRNVNPQLIVANLLRHGTSGR